MKKANEVESWLSLNDGLSQSELIYSVYSILTLPFLNLTMPLKVSVLST